MLYLSIFLLLVALRFWQGPGSVGANRTYVFVLVALFLFSAFRFEVGCDWTGYYYQFHGRSGSWFVWTSGVSPLEAEENRQPLWRILIEFVGTMGLAYPWLNVLTSMIFFMGIHALAKRQPDRLGFLVLLFPVLIINMPMSGIRQAAAIGVLSFAFNAFVDKRLARFVLFVLAASLIHDSSLIFFLLTPLVNGSYTRRRLALAALMALPGIVVLLGSGAAGVAMTRYVDTDLDAAGAVFRCGMLTLSGLFFFLFLKPGWKEWSPEDYKLASIGSVIMIANLALLPVSTVISDRFGYFLIPVQALILARVPFLRLGGKEGIFTLLCYVAMAIVLLTWITLSWHFDGCYVPYRTWLFGFPSTGFY